MLSRRQFLYSSPGLRNHSALTYVEMPPLGNGHDH